MIIHIILIKKIAKISCYSIQNKILMKKKLIQLFDWNSFVILRISFFPSSSLLLNSRALHHLCYYFGIHSPFQNPNYLYCTHLKCRRKRRTTKTKTSGMIFTYFKGKNHIEMMTIKKETNKAQCTFVFCQICGLLIFRKIVVYFVIKLTLATKN